MIKRISLVILAFALSVLAFQALPVHPSRAAVTTWDLKLMGIQENPPVLDDAAGGTVHLTFDDATRILSYSINVSGVGPELVLAGHIHAGPAPVGVNTAPKYPLLDKGQTYASGKVTIDAADVPALLAGDLYINVHTIAHPDGAARAQIESTIKTIFRLDLAARNRGDIATLMSLYTDDAVQPSSGPVTNNLCTVSACVGKADIQRQAENAIANHVQLTIVGQPEISGNVVTARVEFRNDPTRAAGFDRQIFLHTRTFRGDKISIFSGEADLTDAQTAAFRASQAAAAPAVRPPSTGDAGLVANQSGQGRLPEFAGLLLCVGSAGLLLTRRRI